MKHVGRQTDTKDVVTQDQLNLKANIQDPAFLGKMAVGTSVAAGIGVYFTFPAGVLSTANQTGLRVRPTVDPAVVSVFVGNQLDPVISDVAGTITEVVGYRAIPPSLSGTTSTVNLLSGFYAPAAGSTQFLDYRGVRSNVNLVSGVARWGSSFEGTAPNYMNGDLRIGTTTQNGTDKITVAGSGSFTGALRLGTFTLATRPSAALWANYSLTVTDTVGGPQQQTSNGSAWLPTNAGTWTALTLASGFTAGATAPQYRIIDDTVEFRGKIVIVAMLLGNVTRQFATMPAGYRPSWLVSDTDPLRLPISNVTSGVGSHYLHALRAGAFSVGAAGGMAAGDILDLSNIRYSLA